MPRKRVVGKARIEYGSGHLSQLRYRWDFFRDGFGDPANPENIKAMKRAWPELRQEVMELNRQQYGNFHRPWAWWRFEADIDERLAADAQKKFLIERPHLLTPEEKRALG